MCMYNAIQRYVQTPVHLFCTVLVVKRNNVLNKFAFPSHIYSHTNTLHQHSQNKSIAFKRNTVWGMNTVIEYLIMIFSLYMIADHLIFVCFFCHYLACKSLECGAILCCYSHYFIWCMWLFFICRNYLIKGRILDNCKTKCVVLSCTHISKTI
jgi:uncharacterized membrane protein (GlpM family)